VKKEGLVVGFRGVGGEAYRRSMLRVWIGALWARHCLGSLCLPFCRIVLSLL
jgi:hypothetical protein